MPEKEDGPAVTDEATNTKPNQHHEVHDQNTAASDVAGKRRRRQASYRLPIMAGGHSDPWRPYRGRCGAYADAAQHLNDAGLIAAPIDLDALREMWRGGGRKRLLAQRIAQCWEVVA